MFHSYWGYPCSCLIFVRNLWVEKWLYDTLESYEIAFLKVLQTVKDWWMHIKKCIKSHHCCISWWGYGSLLSSFSCSGLTFLWELTFYSLSELFLNAVHPKDTKFWHLEGCYESKFYPQDTEVWKKEKGLFKITQLAGRTNSLCLVSGRSCFYSTLLHCFPLPPVWKTRHSTFETLLQPAFCHLATSHF